MMHVEHTTQLMKPNSGLIHWYSCLHHYNDTYVLAKKTITVLRKGVDEVDPASTAADRNNKEVIFKSWEPFTDCFSENKSYLNV